MQSTQTFSIGQRVELHPASDLWMRGARFGVVVAVTRTRVHVRLDATQRIHRFPADMVSVVS